MLYLNTIEQLFLFVEQLDQLEVCLPYIRLLTGIPIPAVFKNLRWNSNKTSLHQMINETLELFNPIGGGVENIPSTKLIFRGKVTKFGGVWKSFLGS